MTEELKKIIKSLNGRVLAFGFKLDKFEKIVDLNKNITSFDVLDELIRKKNKLFGRNKTILISDLRKKYKRKNIDDIILNVDSMDKYMIELVKETIYIGKKNVYLYGKKALVEETLNKYRRYNINYQVFDFKDNEIVRINIENSKNNYFKDKYYVIKDKVSKLTDYLIDFLTS